MSPSPRTGGIIGADADFCCGAGTIGVVTGTIGLGGIIGIIGCPGWGSWFIDGGMGMPPTGAGAGGKGGADPAGADVAPLADGGFGGSGADWPGPGVKN